MSGDFISADAYRQQQVDTMYERTPEETEACEYALRVFHAVHTSTFPACLSSSYSVNAPRAAEVGLAPAKCANIIDVMVLRLFTVPWRELLDFLKLLRDLVETEASRDTPTVTTVLELHHRCSHIAEQARDARARTFQRTQTYAEDARQLHNELQTLQQVAEENAFVNDTSMADEIATKINQLTARIEAAEHLEQLTLMECQTHEYAARDAEIMRYAYAMINYACTQAATSVLVELSETDNESYRLSMFLSFMALLKNSDYVRAYVCGFDQRAKKSIQKILDRYAVMPEGKIRHSFFAAFAHVYAEHSHTRISDRECWQYMCFVYRFGFLPERAHLPFAMY